MTSSICLYCLSSSGNFNSVEHVVPQSLGNNQVILPKGIVCDKCNNGVLARLDKTFMDYEYFKFMRTWNRIPNKAGILPTARLGNMEVVPLAEGSQINMPNRSKKHFRVVKNNKDGSFEFKLNMLGRKTTKPWLRDMTRAVFKIGLGMIWINDPTLAYSSEFNEVREIIAGKDFNGYLIITTDKPLVKGNLQWRKINFKNGKSTIFLELNIYGCVFMTDMNYRQVGDPEALKKVEGLTLLEF